MFGVNSWHKLNERYNIVDDPKTLEHAERPFAPVGFVNDYCVEKIADRYEHIFSNSDHDNEYKKALSSAIWLWRYLMRFWELCVNNHKERMAPAEKESTASSDASSSSSSSHTERDTDNDNNDATANGNSDDSCELQRRACWSTLTDDEVDTMVRAITSVCCVNGITRARITLESCGEHGTRRTHTIEVNSVTRHSDDQGEMAFIKNAIKNIGLALAYALRRECKRFQCPEFLLSHLDISSLSKKSQKRARAEVDAAQRELEVYFQSYVDANARSSQLSQCIDHHKPIENCLYEVNLDDSDDDSDDETKCKGDFNNVSFVHNDSCVMYRTAAILATPYTTSAYRSRKYYDESATKCAGPWCSVA